mgnify:CR=1 FL=1
MRCRTKTDYKRLQEKRRTLRSEHPQYSEYPRPKQEYANRLDIAVLREAFYLPMEAKK